MGFFDFLKRNKQSADPRVEATVTKMCFVICKEQRALDQARAADAVQKFMGVEYTVKVENETSLTISRGDECVGMMVLMPMAIPNQEAENMAEGIILWMEGAEVAATHTCHVVVVNQDTQAAEPIASAQAVSRLALVALEVFDGLAVVWGGGSICTSRELFEENAYNPEDDLLPLLCWMRFQVVPKSGKKVGLYTVGMEQFGHMEIEVDQSNLDPMSLVALIADLAHYIIVSGETIRDGDTIGESADERILVRYARSAWDKSKNVYQVKLEA